MSPEKGRVRLRDLISEGFITPEQADDIGALCEGLSERYNRGEITIEQAYGELAASAKVAARAYMQRQRASKASAN